MRNETIPLTIIGDKLSDSSGNYSPSRWEDTMYYREPLPAPPNDSGLVAPPREAPFPGVPPDQAYTPDELFGGAYFPEDVPTSRSIEAIIRHGGPVDNPFRKDTPRHALVAGPAENENPFSQGVAYTMGQTMQGTGANMELTGDILQGVHTAGKLFDVASRVFNPLAEPSSGTLTYPVQIVGEKLSDAGAGLYDYAAPAVDQLEADYAAMPAVDKAAFITGQTAAEAAKNFVLYKFMNNLGFWGDLLAPATDESTYSDLRRQGYSVAQAATAHVGMYAGDIAVNRMLPRTKYPWLDQASDYTDILENFVWQPHAVDVTKKLGEDTQKYYEAVQNNKAERLSR